MKKILLTTGIVLFSLLLFSQSSTTSSRIGRNYNSNGWSMQLAFGPNIAFTDIKQYDYYPVTNYNNEWRFATSLTIQRDFGDIFSLRGQLLYGKLAGTKRVTNRYFEADLFDYSLQTTINFNNLFRSTNQNSPLNIYGIAGIGLSNWKTKLKNLNDDNIIGGNGSANVGMLKMTTEAFIPLGVGISYRISDKIDLNAESTMRITNSDLLDATDSGSKFDMYSYTSLGITYKLGKRNYRKTTTRRKDATPQKHTIDIQKKEKPTVQEFYKKGIKKDSHFKVTINNQIPKVINTDKSYIVRTSINKGDISGPVTFRQIFPAGFYIEPLAKSGGDFTFAGQILTVNWEEAPEARKIAIAYKITAKNINSDTYPVSGIFSYIQNGVSELIPFKNTIEVINKTRKEYTPQQIKPKVEYRVQIRAKYRRKYNIELLKSNYNISERINEDYHNGYYIYTVGSFNTYDQANAKKKSLKRDGIIDAFVVVFKNQKRLNKLSDL